jgi:CRP-like cAMP-binding protein
MLLDNLSEEEKALVGQICDLHSFSAGETIIQEGDTGNAMFLVREGRAEARKRLDADNYKFLKTLLPGDMFGEMAFLGGAARSATVVAQEDCRVLEMPRDKIDQLAAENPSLGVKLYRTIACELAARLQRNNQDLRLAVLWAIEGGDPDAAFPNRL